MKNFILSFSLLSLVACQGKIDKQSGDHSADGDTSRQKEVISALLDSFNVAAANADFDRYFGFYTIMQFLSEQMLLNTGISKPS